MSSIKSQVEDEPSCLVPIPILSDPADDQGRGLSNLHGLPAERLA